MFLTCCAIRDTWYEFAGLTNDEVVLPMLEQTQEHLIAQLLRSLTKTHREFLLSLVRAEPEWGLLPFANLQHLPALQWKLLNLRKLKSRAARRFAAHEHELAARLNDLS